MSHSDAFQLTPRTWQHNVGVGSYAMASWWHVGTTRDRRVVLKNALRVHPEEPQPSADAATQEA